MIDTNVKGLLNVTQAILPIMKERQKGHIINIGSVSGIYTLSLICFERIFFFFFIINTSFLIGQQVYTNGGVYCASKHAVDAISRTLLLELVILINYCLFCFEHDA